LIVHSGYQIIVLYHFNMTKIVLIGLLVILSAALKQSEVGVNDWAINTLG
jgi:hypothetical protein